MPLKGMDIALKGTVPFMLSDLIYLYLILFSFLRKIRENKGISINADDLLLLVHHLRVLVYYLSKTNVLGSHPIALHFRLIFPSLYIRPYPHRASRRSRTTRPSCVPRTSSFIDFPLSPHSHHVTTRSRRL